MCDESILYFSAADLRGEDAVFPVHGPVGQGGPVRTYGEGGGDVAREEVLPHLIAVSCVFYCQGCKPGAPLDKCCSGGPLLLLCLAGKRYIYVFFLFLAGDMLVL